MSQSTERRNVAPFGSDIVEEPRQIEQTIESLNKRPLERVLAEFGKLQAQSIPRLGAVPNAVVVLSPEPGCGKSHLIGRLFRKLDDDATLIYVRAYQDPSSCWITVLERLVSELNYADDPTKVALQPGDLTQLDVLARRLTVNLVDRLLRAGKAEATPEPERARDFFARYPNSVFETPEWRGWLQSNFKQLLPALDSLLASDGIQLLPNRTAWLRVLFKYAFSEADHELRQTCLEWLKYEPLAEEDATRIGLRPAELPQTDIPYEQRNERSFQRIRELFQLAAYYRPFLVCFDQTELYGRDEELARSFGVVLSRLRRETKNHLLVITANEYIWRKQLFGRFEKADQDGLADPIHLESVGEAEAKELVQQRLTDWEVPQKDQNTFLAGGWLEQMFRGAKSAHSARHVIREASRRWSNPPPVTPQALFDSYRQRLLADPKRLDFDPAVFELLSNVILAPSVSAAVKRFNGARGYMTLEWEANTGDVLLGFQTGSHWKTWETIAREARRHHETRKVHGRRLTASFFRTPEQKAIPSRALTALDEARCVRLVELSRPEAAALYAAHELYADVQQGNQDIGADALVEYLQTELRPFAQRLLSGGKTQPPPPAPDNLDQALSAAVKSMKFGTLEVVLARLARSHTELTRDTILERCRELPAIRVVSSPNSVVLRWIQ